MLSCKESVLLLQGSHPGMLYDAANVSFFLDFHHGVWEYDYWTYKQAEQVNWERADSQLCISEYALYKVDQTRSVMRGMSLAFGYEGLQ